MAQVRNQPANWQDFKGTLGFLAFSAILGFAGLIWQGSLDRPTAFMMGLAATACGAAVGFLFGIPRQTPSATTQTRLSAGPSRPTTVTTSTTIAATAVEGTQAHEAPVNAPVAESTDIVPESTATENTGLGEIADWLTKILLGAGLTQIGQVPSLLEGMALKLIDKATMTPALANKVVAIAISAWLYFALFGFFMGYLLVRLWVVGALQRAGQSGSMEVEAVKRSSLPAEAVRRAGQEV